MLPARRMYVPVHALGVGERTGLDVCHPVLMHALGVGARMSLDVCHPVLLQVHVSMPYKPFKRRRGKNGNSFKAGDRVCYAGTDFAVGTVDGWDPNSLSFRIIIDPGQIVSNQSPAEGGGVFLAEPGACPVRVWPFSVLPHLYLLPHRLPASHRLCLR